MAGLYLVGAWLVVQVASTVFPAFELPGWALRGVIVLVAIGFVPAMALSWAFEFTPEGLKRDAEVTASDSLGPRTARRMERGFLVLLALALGFFAVDKFMLAPDREAEMLAAATQAAKAQAPAIPTPALGRASIAVLPFVSMSSEPDNEPFADGLSEEILNSLGRIDGVQVVGRTSSFQFKGRNEDLRTIAGKLGVSNVLEGSVRREGPRARITAKLVRAGDGLQLWSQSYDRTVLDTLAVQLDIAEQVAAALDVALDDTQRARMRADGVEDVEAFIAFQKGMQLYIDAHIPTKTGDAIESLRVANAQFARAIGLEPDFAQAYFLSADLYNHLLLADGRTPAERKQAQTEGMRLYGLTAEHSHDPQQRALAEVERQMLSDNWRGLAGNIEAALKQPGCRNPDWLPVFAAAFGHTDLIEDLGRRTSACDPLNRVNYASRVRAALAAGRGQQALDIQAESRKALGIAARSSAAQARSLAMLGRLDEATSELAGVELLDEAYFQTAVIVGTLAGEDAAAIDARLQRVDRDASIYDLWESADAIRAAWSGDRAEANRRAAALDARPAGPFLLAVLTADCLCAAPFDVEATPNFKARLAESGLAWPPRAAFPRHVEAARK